MAEHVQEKLREIYDNTIENGYIYEGDVRRPDFYTLSCKAAAENNFYTLMGSNVCMFNCKLDKDDAMMTIFSIPVNSDDTGAKTIAERVMEIVREVEEFFITIDYLKSIEIREDKFVYVTAIKKLNGG